jgi:hypothetical protein
MNYGVAFLVAICVVFGACSASAANGNNKYDRLWKKEKEKGGVQLL